MRNLDKRISALEQFAGAADNGMVIAFILDGASDEEVVAIGHGGTRLERQPGESLAGLVGRAKALDAHAAHPMLFFEYSAECKARLGIHSEEADALPNTWPTPSPASHAFHLEHQP